MNPKEELVSLLKKLHRDDIYALEKLVTQGLKKSRHREDAIKNVIKYSPDEISILRRKTITRDILFDYLESKNVQVKLPITKNELIDKILQLWNLPLISRAAEDETSHSCAPETIGSSNGGTIETYSKKETPSQITEMALQFAQWFYTMVNNNEFGSEHLFPDAKFKLNMYTNTDCDTTVVENHPQDIVQLILQTRSQHNLFFNLNVTSQGIQGRMDPHGLVLVLACGTLHIENSCAGVFEQVFALARDPFCENNWKIKNSELNLRSKSEVLGPPQLCDSELTSELLVLPSD